MSYGARFTIEWATSTADCRLWLKQEGYSGGTTALTPAPTPMSIRWGQQGQDDLTAPLRVSTAGIRFSGDSQGELVEATFDGGDTEWLVKFWRDTGAGYELEWEGYIATDLWRDNPHLSAEVVELEAIDGLALLENRDAYGANLTRYTLTDALRKILRGWTPAAGDSAPMHDLPITTSQDWRPDGLALPSATDDQPLDFLQLPGTAYQELDDQGDVEETLDQRTQLEGIVERLGMQLMLSGGEWKLRQRDQVGDGTSLRQWTMGTSGSVFGSVYTADVTTGLPAVARTEKPRSRASRLRTLESRYSYEGLGELIQTGSFEKADTNGNPLNWSLNTFDSNHFIQRKQYDNNSDLPDGVQGDEWYMALTDGVDNLKDDPFIGQELDTVIDAAPEQVIDLTWDMAVGSVKDNNNEDPTGVAFRFRIGGFIDCEADYLNVRQAANNADDGTIYIEELQPTAGAKDGTLVIPEGSKLPIWDTVPGTPTSESPTRTGFINLTEPARVGDSKLEGSLSEEVPKGHKITYYYWEDFSTRVFGKTQVPQYPDVASALVSQQVRMPLVQPDGTRVHGKPTIEFYVFWQEGALNTAIFDHVSLKTQLSESRYILTDDQFGREETISHRIGDGPTPGHPRGVFDNGNDALFENWGKEPNAGLTGKIVEQLLAEQWMRQQRETIDRRTYECELRGNDSLKPHHVVNFDSKTYTVSYLEREYGTNNDSARVELTQLKDSGVSGLDRTFKMEGDQPVGGGGSIAGGAGGGIGGAAGIEVIELDAGTSNVTETLPAPSAGTTALALRVDTSSNTATIKDPNGNNIIWPGRTNSTSFDLYSHQSVLFSSGGSNWHVENPAIYEIGSFVPGNPATGRIMLRHIARHDLRLVSIKIDAENTASNDVVFDLIVAGGKFADVTVSGGTGTASKSSFSKFVAEGSVMKVVSQDADSGLTDVSLTFDATRA
jgi:hypothetical protein